MSERPGYVYVMRMHVSDDIYACPYKIGKSATPTIRRSQLGVVLPYELTIVSTIKTNNMSWAEASLHELFEADRMYGEWFKLEELDLVYLVGLSSTGFHYYKPPVDDDEDLPF